MSARLDFALDLAYRAGRSTLAHFQVGTSVETKADRTPVTIADREAESLIRRDISVKYPGEAILGEEEGLTRSGGARWVVDPIDGTKSFVAGVPLFATLLAFEENGDQTIGIAYFPALDEMIYAERGQGTFWNGRRCSVSSRELITGAVLCCGSPQSMQRYGRLDGFLKLGESALATRTWSDAYGHCLVATGRAEAMLDPIVSYWDLAAIALIVREAGGSFSTFAGNPAIGTDAISSNGHVHAEVLEAFRN